ncbi:MAG TPA: tetratricopeptide repeat protein [Chthoniobacter sp.]|jgi:Flp pilus assembly protein TadD
MRFSLIFFIACCLSGLPSVAEEANPAPSSTPPSAAAELPPELQVLDQEAQKQFNAGHYPDAEKIFREILAKAPNHLPTILSLGVVLFRSQQLKLAEEQFTKAIALAPDDAFSHTTLGIIHYTQGRYDDAVSDLKKAIDISPKNATAHNYLGITASQRGWMDVARKELELATNLDPNYADAHFNLAVLLATTTPPDNASALLHYHRALKLGAPPDVALERLMKTSADGGATKPPAPTGQSR